MECDANCSVMNHYQIDCVIGPGVGQNLKFAVQVKVKHRPGNKTLKYNRPEVLDVTPDCGNTVGGAEILLTGRHCGLSDPRSSLSIWFSDIGSTGN